MAEPPEVNVPAVMAALDEINHQYGGDLPEYLGENWREVLGPPILAAWTDGYTTGMADAEKAGNG